MSIANMQKSANEDPCPDPLSIRAGRARVSHFRRVEMACFVALTAAALGADSNAAKPPDTAQKLREDKQALAPFNALIGEWRGVGMPRRGSRRGAWSETAEWVWDFNDEAVAIQYDVSKSKLLDSARLTYDTKSKSYHLRASFADDSERTYTGKLSGKKLSLRSQLGDDGYIYELTITQLNPKRTLVAHHKRRPESKFLTRIAEIGYTRKGTSLGVEGSNEPQCVITGGRGTIEVQHKGKTYFVCCSGCQQAFDDDPEGVIAEYRQRLAKRKSAQKTSTAPES